MDYIEKVNKRIDWGKPNYKKNTFSKISDKALLSKVCTECCWCKTKLLLVNTKYEYELLMELKETNPLTVQFDFCGKDATDVGEKFEAKGLPKTKKDLKLPLQCSYEYEWYNPKTESRHRAKGSYIFSVGAEFQDYYPCYKDKCPCCGDNIRSGIDKIEELKNKEYSKIINKYKSKVIKENVELDLSSFDVKNYLGTLVELYKDSFLIEKQVQDLLVQKNTCKIYARGIEKKFIFTKKNNKPREIIIAEKKLDEINNTTISEIQLSMEEEEQAWKGFLKANEEWRNLSENIDETKVPYPPSKLGLKNLFGEVSILKGESEEEYKGTQEIGQNNMVTIEPYSLIANEIIEERETSIKKKNGFEHDCNEIADMLYQIKTNIYLKEKEQYAEEKERRKLLEKKQKEVRANALKSKKDKVKNEKKELEQYLKYYEKELNDLLEKGVNNIPEVVTYGMMTAFLEDEVKNLTRDLFKVYGAIDELKSMNVIYPKYAQFPTLCTLYEYFLSGRANELAGPYGAYNLYESEIRADNIINRLDMINTKMDVIIDQLDEIKGNQILLYNMMREVKTGVERVVDGISKMTEELTRIGQELIDSVDEVSDRVSKSGENIEKAVNDSTLQIERVGEELKADTSELIEIGKDIREDTKNLLEIGEGIRNDTSEIADYAWNIQYDIRGTTMNNTISNNSSSSSAVSFQNSHPVSTLPSYSSYDLFMTEQRLSIGNSVKKASAIKRGIAGAIIAGPAGAVIGAISAVDHNNRK